MFSFFQKKPPEAVVVVRIKHTNFKAAIDALPGTDGYARPITEPLFGDLLLTYALAMGDNYMAFPSSALSEYKLQQSELRELGMTNCLPAMRTITTRTDGTVHQLTADENMGACSVLFSALWDQIEEELGGPVVIAITHRDFVYYCRADSAAGIETIKGVVAETDYSETHALSKLMYVRAETDWCVFQH